ncbi:protein MGARP isoform X1 [Carettochelys insculpta]|uniref:protein MGARP isoform X1 n=1 Tax=Carettochelys insculpta TaxID=44489 RepID=UPI003EBD5B46
MKRGPGRAQAMFCARNGCSAPPSAALAQGRVRRAPLRPWAAEAGLRLRSGDRAGKMAVPLRKWLFLAPGSLSRTPLRQMSSGSVPGSSGENLIYYLCAGVVSAAGLFYGYRTVISDKKRYNERIQAIQQSNTAEWKPKPWPPECGEMETAEVSEESMQTPEAPTEEADTLTTDESTEQNERSVVSTEAAGEKESPVADASSAVEEAQQEATANLETAQVQD